MTWVMRLVADVAAVFTLGLAICGVWSAWRWWRQRRRFARYLRELEAEAEQVTRNAASRAMPL